MCGPSSYVSPNTSYVATTRAVASAIIATRQSRINDRRVFESRFKGVAT
jgi:hypothetical protein